MCCLASNTPAELLACTQENSGALPGLGAKAISGMLTRAVAALQTAHDNALPSILRCLRCHKACAVIFVSPPQPASVLT